MIDCVLFAPAYSNGLCNKPQGAFTRLALIFPLSAKTCLAFATTTVTHTGALPAVSGPSAKTGQAIVNEDLKITEGRKGYSAPAVFGGDVTVTDLTDQFALPAVVCSAKKTM